MVFPYRLGAVRSILYSPAGLRVEVTLGLLSLWFC